MEQLDTNTRLAEAYDTHMWGQQVHIYKHIYKENATKIGHFEKYKDFISLIPGPGTNELINK